MEKIEVVSPVGLDAVGRRSAAQRIDDLNGKTVCEIWNGVFKGDVAFPIIREALRQRFPGVRIIPYTEFAHTPGSDNPTQQREVARQSAMLAKDKGGDAVITGIGA